MGLSKTIWMAQGDLDVLKQRADMSYDEQVDTYGSFMDSEDIAKEKANIEKELGYRL